MDFSRADRIQSQIIKELSLIVSNELKDKPPVMITFTRAEISRDLKYAKVYFSAFGDEEEMSKAHRFLIGRIRVFRRLLGGRIRMRQVPELRFVYDDSAENVLRINKLLNEIDLKEEDEHDEKDS
jgi:ribosome-binding factor A